MKCIDCPHFEIKMEPWKGVDFGLAVCKKYDLVCDYTGKRQLKRLVCVEGGKNDQEKVYRRG